MGGSEAINWIGALEASFEAGRAREEDIAAADLAFSLGQDVDVRGVIARSQTGWVLAGADAAATPVDEVGADYVRAGDLVVPSRGATLRSATGARPSPAERTFLELLGEACRTGATATVVCGGTNLSGRLVRVGNDHLALQHGDVETMVGLAAVQTVRLPGYSDSRGFRG